MYRGLLGPYPYAKFALVENFWETGYGMPSFTLLGEQVHPLSVHPAFVLSARAPAQLVGQRRLCRLCGGNWCEGLTAYLADHLIAEQRGQGAEHRRAILQRVTDYVTPENDFPLTRFQSRYNAVTEAVGYGKTAMVFNMLREKVGDAQFIKALQQFYRDNRFRRRPLTTSARVSRRCRVSICARISISGSRPSERRSSSSSSGGRRCAPRPSRSRRCSPGISLRSMFLSSIETDQGYRNENGVDAGRQGARRGEL
jgi:hypothetical protein